MFFSPHAPSGVLISQLVGKSFHSAFLVLMLSKILPFLFFILNVPLQEAVYLTEVSNLLKARKH